MNVEVPDPLPLELPPGNAEVLTGAVQEIAGAAFHLNVLASSLAGPAASAPGWLGDDAAAAVEQVGAAAALARRTAEAVLAGMHRLSAHAECLHEARRRVAALEREQEDDFAATWARLSQIEDQVQAVQTGAPAWVGPIDDLRAAEESRRRRHAAVLEEVADDAAATARVLADSCGAMGGRGTPGDSARVLAYFAAELPGWGDRELAGRGRALAEALGHRRLDPQGLDDDAGDAGALAASPAFAEAFLRSLGEDGMRETLARLGEGDFGAHSPLAQLMVTVLGATGLSGSVDEVVRAPYVDAADFRVAPDQIALGMAVVLAAATRRSGSGLPPAIVAAWGRQIILREARQGAPAIDRVGAMVSARPEIDAVPLVVELLSRGADGAEAAGLLSEPDAWRVLLARTWDDCGNGLGRLVSLAGGESGRDGGAALRAGLEALGTGLEDGGLDGWTVQRASANAVAQPLADGLAVHWGIPAGILAAGADGEASDRDRSRLRGLGYLTMDPGASAAIGQAVTTWVAHQPPVGHTVVAASPPAVVAVPAAYLAVREYGQQFAYVLDAYEREAEAQDRQLRWDMSVGLVAEVLRARLGHVAGVLEPFAARLFDAAGDWAEGPDRSTVFESRDAVAAARAQAPLEDRAELAAVSAQARPAFDGTAAALGVLDVPTPPTAEEHWLETALDGAHSVPSARLDELPKVWRALTN